jgi:2-oxoisovalerate dehydrogenase E1 component alpha subunit
VVRLTSHSSDDDQRRYRDPAEVEALKEQDPVSRFAASLREMGLLDDAKDAEYRAAAKEEINEASRRAEARPDPDPATAEQHVYADSPAPGAVDGGSD